MSEGNLLAHVARFARALRQRQVPATLADEIDAVAAMTRIDLADRDEVRRALRVALKIRRRDQDAFEELFDRFWNAAAPPETFTGAPRLAPPSHGPALGRRIEAEAAEDAGSHRTRNVPEGGAPGWSAEALLRRKPFEACTEADLAAMERVVAKAAYRLATRRSRRRVPARGRGEVDPRRSLRGAVSTGGDVLRWARRERRIEKPRLVLLCDTSGSMDSHARFLLTFLFALKKAARSTEIFVFNTALTRLTPWLSPARIGPTLERLVREVPDWSGGTRIGESLARFVRDHADALLDSKTIVVVVSDGLDRGEADVLANAMRTIHARARRVIWLNPLLGDPRYEPTARGMEAALPFVDLLAPAHDFESLERLIPRLSA